METRVHLTGLDGALRRVGLLDMHTRGKIVTELDRTALMIESGAKRNLNRNRSRDTSRLASSVVRQAYGQFSRKVGSNLKYAPVVEFGRRPGKFPPIRFIKAWAVRQGLPEAAAYPIARKIARRGIPPKPYLYPAAEAARGEFLNNMRNILKDFR